MQDAVAVQRIEAKFQALEPLMDERVRRQWAAAEAKAYGWVGLPLRLGQLLAQGQQREHHRLFPLLKQTPRFRLGQCAEANRIPRRCSRNLHARRHAPQT